MRARLSNLEKIVNFKFYGNVKNQTSKIIKTKEQFLLAKEKYNFRICKLTLDNLVKITNLLGLDTHRTTCEKLSGLEQKTYDIHTNIQFDNKPSLISLLTAYELANSNWKDPISINYFNNKYFCHPGTTRLSFSQFFPNKAVDVMLWGDECELDKYIIDYVFDNRPFELLHQEMYQRIHKSYVNNLQWLPRKKNNIAQSKYFSNNYKCEITKNNIFLDNKCIYKIIDNRWHIRVPSGWFSFDEHG
jgi:hypothetical protein